MKRATYIVVRALLSASVLSSLATVGWSQQPAITWLGTLGGSLSRAYSVSADGSVVVGWAYNNFSVSRAFRWTEEGMQDLGALPGSFVSYAYGVSADGSVVIGGGWNSDEQTRALRWANGVLQDLGTLGGYDSGAYGVSADGSVVVGFSTLANNARRAFRWTAQSGMVDLGVLPGGNYSHAYGVSADGSVVVGVAFNADGNQRALRWRNNTIESLGTLPGETQSGAWGASADGSVVVGWSGGNAFRWVEGVGMQNLGSGQAHAVSGDGKVVVGSYVTGFETFVAFRWTEANGREDLNVAYASLLTGGDSLWEALGVSPNGRYIVGWGYHNGQPRAFLLDTGFPLRGDVDRNGCVDDADLLAVLFAFGERGYRNEDLNWDGAIDDADLLQVLFHFGSGC